MRVGVVDRDGPGAGRWPCRDGLGGCSGGGCSGGVCAVGGGREGAAGVAGPLGVLAVPGRVHADGPAAVGVRGADGHLDPDGAGGGQDEGGLEHQFFEVGAAGAVAGPDGQFDEGRGGQQDGAEDGVVGQPGQGLEGQRAGERDAAAVGQRYGRGQQRVAGGVQAGCGHVRAGGRGGQPVALPVEGVGGQFDAAAGGAVGCGGPADRRAGDVDAGQGGEEVPQAAVVPAQGAGHRGGRSAVAVPFGGGLDADGEDGVRADLHEGAVAGGEQFAGGVGEADGLPEVAEPVVGVQGPRVGDLGAGHGGVERDVAAPRRDAGECGGQAFPDGFDLCRVRGVVDGDAAGGYLPRGAFGEEFGEGFGLAGDHDGRGAVDGGDLKSAAPAVDELGHLGQRQRDGGHAAPAGEHGEGLAAQGDDAGRVVEGERAGDVRCGDLALGVADDGVGPHAVGLPQAGQGHQDGEQDRLDDVDAVQGGCAGFAAQDVQQREVQVGGEGVGAGGEVGAEDGRFLHQPGAHAGPLGALAGEDEDSPGVVGGGALEHVAVGPAVGQGAQAGEEFVRSGAEDHGPVGECGASRAEGVGDVGG